jgi:hypothetical protein
MSSHAFVLRTRLRTIFTSLSIVLEAPQVGTGTTLVGVAQRAVAAVQVCFAMRGGGNVWGMVGDVRDEEGRGRGVFMCYFGRPSAHSMWMGVCVCVCMCVCVCVCVFCVLRRRDCVCRAGLGTDDWIELKFCMVTVLRCCIVRSGCVCGAVRVVLCNVGASGAWGVLCGVLFSCVVFCCVLLCSVLLCCVLVWSVVFCCVFRLCYALCARVSVG